MGKHVRGAEMRKKLALAGVGALLAIEPFTEILIVRAAFPNIPPMLLVLGGLGIIIWAIR